MRCHFKTFDGAVKALEGLTADISRHLTVIDIRFIGTIDENYIRPNMPKNPEKLRGA